MATLFGMFPFLLQLDADGGYQGPLFRAAVRKVLKQVSVDIVKLSDAPKGFVILPKRCAVHGRRAHLCVVRQVQKTGEGLGVPEPGGTCVPASGLDPPHVEKAMQSNMISSDRLSGIQDPANDIRARCNTNAMAT